MAEPITELTDDQKQMLEDLKQEWIGYGLSIDPANFDEAFKGAAMAYQAAELSVPSIAINTSSPWAGVIAQGLAPKILDDAYSTHGITPGDPFPADIAAKLKEQIEIEAAKRVAISLSVHAEVQSASYIRRSPVNKPVRDEAAPGTESPEDDFLAAFVADAVDVKAVAGDLDLSTWHKSRIAGNLWAGYYGWIEAHQKLGVEGLEPILGQQHVARHCGWWWVFADFIVFTDRPCVLKRDAQERLHSADGPAVQYRDGWGIYSWHGTRIPGDLIENGWSAERILSEPNTEIRRCAIEVMGWEQFIKDAKLNLIDESDDPGNEGQKISLYDLPQQIYGEPVRVLLCTNGTQERDGTRHRFGLTVPASCQTALAAAAWGYDVTPEQYAQIARRT